MAETKQTSLRNLAEDYLLAHDELRGLADTRQQLVEKLAHLAGGFKAALGLAYDDSDDYLPLIAKTIIRAGNEAEHNANESQT